MPDTSCLATRRIGGCAEVRGAVHRANHGEAAKRSPIGVTEGESQTPSRARCEPLTEKLESGLISAQPRVEAGVELEAGVARRHLDRLVVVVVPVLDRVDQLRHQRARRPARS